MRNCSVLAFFGLFAFSVLMCVSITVGQGSRADYERVRSFRSRTADKVFPKMSPARWLSGSRSFCYRVQIGPERFRFKFVDAILGERRDAFDHERLAQSLASASQEPVDPERFPFRALHFSDDGTVVHFSAFGKQWKCDLGSYQVSATRDADMEATVHRLDRPRRSRDGGGETYIRFVNRTDGAIKLYWVTRAGDFRHYRDVAAGESFRQHTYDHHVWVVTDSDYRPLAIFEAEGETGDAVVDGTHRVQLPESFSVIERDGRVSPDGRWRVFVENHNLHLREQQSGDVVVLTSDGTEGDRYRGPFRWSPDSTRLVAFQEQPGEQREIHVIESSPSDQLQPKLHTLSYAKPGDRLARRQLRLFDVVARAAIPVADGLFLNPWSISDVRWQPDSKRFTFVYNQRGHQTVRLVAVDAANGAATIVIDETSDTFVDYAHKLFAHHLDESGEVIWMSERDGWNHLYLCDSRTGKVKNRITQGDWVVREVERVDAVDRRIWFWAGGIFPEQDPYYLHLCRANLDGSGLTVLTSGNGTHSVDFSPNREYFIDTYSRVDLPPVTELRRSEDGALVCRLEKADWSALLATGWRPPERFVAKGRDGQTDIYGVIYRPSSFDPGHSYPVIEKIYAGPHGAFVPKRFAAYRPEQANAELGFVVVQIDGMGTSHRSKAFHNVCWKNLGDSGFPDRIRWLEAAAQKYPSLDLSRVGIYGGSAGGQSALRALLAHGDFYKVAVSDCGCHDNRMDKVWWNELWMGWPVGPHYAEQSNVTNAHKLEGKLLLTVGELDGNVDPASTMQVVDALIKADKDFDLLVVPGAGHGVGESPYARRRRRDFFVEHLLGVAPRWAPSK